MRRCWAVSKFYPRSIARLSHNWETVTPPRWQEFASFAARWPRIKGVSLKAGALASRTNWRLNSGVSKRHTTIYALSTAPGRAAIAIIRVSGPACLDIYHALSFDKAGPKPRYATLRTLYEPSSSPDGTQILDPGALVLYFPAPETVTGEDVLELHVHGGPAVVKAVLAAIPKVIPDNNRLQSIRYAEPGEFTKRAFYNNRLDLTQVEALGDALTAETEQQRRLAVRVSTSTLAARYDTWRRELLYARGELEALIDFSEDQHFHDSPAALFASVAEQVRGLQQQLRASIQSAKRGELLRNGISIALVGAPNAGKSSLFNQIVGRDAAIVSAQEGTTRDVVDASVDIGGYLCRVGDLAGLRSGRLGNIEQEGIRRARERALEADVVIVLLSVEVEGGEFDPESESVPNCDRADSPQVYLYPEVEALLAQLDPDAQKVICVLNKADLFENQSDIDYIHSRFDKHPALHRLLEASKIPIISISCEEPIDHSKSDKENLGVEPLLQALTRLFRSMTEAVAPGLAGDSGSDSAWAESLGATERQRVLLEQCLSHLDKFLVKVLIEETGTAGDSKGEEDIDVVLAAEQLRSAASCLAKITGKGEMAGDVEEVLGVVFEKFCVGK